MQKKIAILVLLLISWTSFAQNDFQKAFSDFEKMTQSNFASFSDKNEKEFTDLLKRNWIEFQVFQGKEYKKKPKPQKAPIVVADTVKTPETMLPTIQDTIPAKETTIAKVNPPIEEIVEPSVEVPDTTKIIIPITPPEEEKIDTVVCKPQEGEVKDKEVGANLTSFSFYNEKHSVSVPSGCGQIHPKGIKETEVAAFWSNLNKLDFHTLLTECKSTQKARGYNDWAVYQWICALAEQVYPSDSNNERLIFTVYLLNGIGLDAKLARVGSRLTCLISTRQTLYSRTYILIGETPYYTVESHPIREDIYTYKANSKDKLKPFDMAVHSHLDLGSDRDICYKEQKSSVFGRNFSIPLNTELCKFYADYPQLDVLYYAQAPVSGSMDNYLKRNLGGMLKGKTTTEAVATILKYLHKDFPYITDDEQFGREKPLFCEESYMYDYTDCEDRSVLFAYLVKSLTGLDVILLDYPDHIATAVRFNENVSGDYIEYNNSRYYVCDPTYIGAPIGYSMPDYKSIPANIIVID